MQVNQKQTDLSMSSSDFGGRDLKTVETDYAEKSEKLSQYMDKVCCGEEKVSKVMPGSYTLPTSEHRLVN
jgi:hypothetical protein